MADVNYGDVTRTRKLARLLFEELLTGKTASPLQLSRWAKAISSVKKGGVTLATPADYSFVEPNQVTLVMAPVAGDRFLILSATDKTDAEVAEKLVEASGFVNDRLAALYKVPFTTTGGKFPPELSRITEWLAASFLAQELYMGEQNNLSEVGKDYYSKAMEALQPLMRNEAPVVHADGSFAVKKSIIQSSTKDEADIFSVEDEAQWGKLFESTRADGRSDSTAAGTNPAGYNQA